MKNSSLEHLAASADRSQKSFAIRGIKSWDCSIRREGPFAEGTRHRTDHRHAG